MKVLKPEKKTVVCVCVYVCLCVCMHAYLENMSRIVTWEKTEDLRIGRQAGSEWVEGLCLKYEVREVRCMAPEE